MEAAGKCGSGGGVGDVGLWVDGTQWQKLFVNTEYGYCNRIENRTKSSAETREAPVVFLVSAEESDVVSSYCPGNSRSQEWHKSEDPHS